MRFGGLGLVLILAGGSEKCELFDVEGRYSNLVFVFACEKIGCSSVVVNFETRMNVRAHPGEVQWEKAVRHQRGINNFQPPADFPFLTRLHDSEIHTS